MKGKINKIKGLAKNQHGFLATIGLVLIAIMTITLMDMARLSVEDDKNRQFLQRKSRLFNDLLSAVNETRWETYRYYNTGEATPQFLRSLQGRNPADFENAYKITPNGTIKRRFYVAPNKNGGNWYFTAYNQDIIPHLSWFFRTENNIIQESFLRP